MKTHRFLLTFFCSIAIHMLAQDISYPKAEKQPIILEQHGDRRCDNYAWLREKHNPKVIQYLSDWNHYTHQYMQRFTDVQNALYQEMYLSRQQTVRSASYSYGVFDYYSIQKENQDYSTLWRTHQETGQIECLLDQNDLASSYPYFKLMNWEPSPNGKYVALAIDITGTQCCTIFIIDCLTKQILEEKIAHVASQIIWDVEGCGFWYVAADETYRQNRVLYHLIETPTSVDQMVFLENDAAYDVDISLSSNHRFLFIRTASKDVAEVWSKDLQDSQLQLIYSRNLKYDYHVDTNQTHFFFTLKDKSGNKSLMKAPLDQPKQTQVCIPASQHAQIIDFKVINDSVILCVVEEGQSKIVIYHVNTATCKTIEFPEEIYSVNFAAQKDEKNQYVYFEYTSFITPPSIYTYNIETDDLKLLWQKPVGQIKGDQYVIRRICVPAQDGTLIPLTLFYHRDALKAGAAPLLLQGYGAYGVTFEPYFNSSLLALVDRHVIVAIAHIRGGGEKGHAWYDKGRRFYKMNTFTDFIACAEFLIQQGYTKLNRLAIEGGSAGGLLIGAVINERPELFKVAVAEVPFVDVLTTMLDTTIPLTTQEFEEWGNPALKDDYFYIKKYSPYDNIKRMNYPALYVTAGLNDAQVAYWEPAKWVAKLLEYKTDDHPLLFKVNLTAGHHSSARPSEKYKEIAAKYAFVLSQITP